MFSIGMRKAQEKNASKLRANINPENRMCPETEGSPNLG